MLTATPERPTQPADVMTLPVARFIDVNAVQAAAESVAERHFRTYSPEWVEFVVDRMDGPLAMQMMQGQHWLALAPLRAEFVEWTVDNYLSGGRTCRALYNDMRREVWQ